ncbi:MAG TPA: hypothetical protein VE377_04570 [Candidatus Dormibacteraeota bacterium]|nr:hypothetical protein [Candidatus Dormibacteraeota bacterium]
MIREILQQEWEYHRERPFGRLVQLFVARIFRGGGDTDAEGIDLGIGLVLTLLALPGGFVSVFLFDKYGSLLQWLRGQVNVDPLLIAFPDEYFFIVLSMTVTGAVAVWRWDAVFPDRRDYMNLAHLPVSTRTIFFANLVAVLLLVGMVAVDVNAASCVLFPMVVSASQMTLSFFVKFAVIHALGVLLSGVFSFLAVFSVLGMLMAVFPARALRRVSAYARGAVVVYLVTILCTSFAIPDLLRRANGPAPAWTFLFPSCWFVSLCQTLRGRANPAMVELARLCVPGIVAVAVIAFAAYAVGYRRHFVRIAETAEGTVMAHRPAWWRFGILDRWVLRTPFQKGCFGFVGRTLVRSEAHRLVITGVTGLALVLASQALMNAFEGAPSRRQAAMTAEALSIPFIVTFLMIVGLRIIFEVPAELRANWIFQLMLDADGQECEPLARKVILVAVLPWVLATTFGTYLYLEGLVIAFLHATLVMVWAVLLTNIVLTQFRKLAFTCSLPVFKQHSIVIVIAFCFGFLIYAVSTPEFESSALLEPARMLSLVPVALVAWYVPRYLGRNTIELEKRMIFEEAAVRTVEGLRLSE